MSSADRSPRPPQAALPTVNLDQCEALIFDLGGVVIDLYPSRTVEVLSQLFSMDAASVYARARDVALFDEFERGEISANQFRVGLRELFDGRVVVDAEMDRAWNAMLGVIPEPHLEVLGRLGAIRRTFVLSNTNEIHVRRFLSDYEERHEKAHGPLSRLFEHVHFSNELGMRKPELRIFEALIKRHDLNPEKTVFLDDNAENIEAAKQLGLIAVHHPTNSPLQDRFPSLAL